MYNVFIYLFIFYLSIDLLFYLFIYLQTICNTFFYLARQEIGTKISSILFSYFLISLQGAAALALQFELLLQSSETRLWQHCAAMGIQL